MSNNIDRAKELLTLINKYDYEYFSNNQSLVSDEQYDELWFELRDLLQNNEIAKAVKKYSMPLASEHSHLQKVQHILPVLSLDKVKLDDNYVKNMKRFIKKHLNNDLNQKVSFQSKLDGLTIVIYKYKDKTLFVTRGGGSKGEDVTQQFINNEELMQSVNSIENGMVIRCEAIITKDNFEQLNQSLDNKYSNARNLASSSVRTKDTNTALEYKVDLVAYDIMNASKFDLNTEKQVLEYLDMKGFNVVNEISLKAEDLLNHDYVNQTSSNFRNNESYEIDGIVIKPDDRSLVNEDDGHHQKGQIAIKFKPQSKETQLLDVQWNIGNEGRMTPIAVFEPINIGGTEIKRASLGSWNTLTKLDLKIGDVINVMRSNDVIPQVDSVEKDRRTGNEIDIEFPKDAYLDGKILYYKYYEKPLEDQLDTFANQVGIRSAKKSTFKKIVEAGYIERISDIYHLRTYREQLVEIKGLSYKKIDDLLDEIDYTRDASFKDVLTGLAIPHVGKVAAEHVELLFETWNNFKSSNDDEIDKMLSFNYKTKKSLKDLLKVDNQYHIKLEQLSHYLDI